MNTIEDILMQDESIIHRAVLHRKVLIGAAIPLLLGILLLVPSMYMAFYRSHMDQLYGILFIAACAALIWAGINNYLNFKTAEFALTNKRIIIKKGVRKIKINEILLGKIDSIMVTLGAQGGPEGSGRLDIKGTSGSTETISGIIDPMTFKKKAQDEIAKYQGAAPVAQAPDPADKTENGRHIIPDA